MKKLIGKIMIISLLFSLIGGSTALAAPEWPDDSGVVLESEAGVVMDADSKAVLYGKNSKEQYFPASITKIMTALLVLENCSLDEVVTFSHDAVYNVESGSTNAGIDEGEQMTVKDCLYAMMLKSANEAANALAEHVSGSREAFAELMTRRAKELGCENTSFKNPSGLNDPEHYTTARDFALIVQAAWENEAFRQIESELTYRLPPTANDPEGLTVRQEHKMMLEEWEQYYDPDVKGGKTGYTTLAGNTLATVAERDGRTLIAVILKGQKTDHYTTYTDTRQLLDYGFDAFENLSPASEEADLDGLRTDLAAAGAETGEGTALTVDGAGSVTVPSGAVFSDLSRAVSLEVPEDAPENAVAVLSYNYGGRPVGSAYVLAEETAAPAPEETEAAVMDPEKAGTEAGSFSFAGFLPFLLAAAAVLVIAAAAWYHSVRVKRENARRRERLMARRRRLEESGVSMEEFDRMMKERQERLGKKR